MKDDKIIITVGRQIGSGGRTIAKIFLSNFTVLSMIRKFST
jgi:hypothetical protein